MDSEALRDFVTRLEAELGQEAVRLLRAKALREKVSLEFLLVESVRGYVSRLKDCGANEMSPAT